MALLKQEKQRGRPSYSAEDDITFKTPPFESLLKGSRGVLRVYLAAENGFPASLADVAWNIAIDVAREKNVFEDTILILVEPDSAALKDAFISLVRRHLHF